MNKLLPARKLGDYKPEHRRNTPYRPTRKQYERQEKRQSAAGISGEAVLFCALMLLMIITGVGLIGMYGKVVAVNYQVEQSNRELAKLVEENEYLSIEVKKLSSLERIENIAINELGLQYPEQRQWLFLSSRQKNTENTR